MPYNPFDKPIGDKLSADDLQKLIGKVAEGYFVEYKSDFPANDKIGRSIASFANTYGGWYIVGVKTDNQHVANDICGFGLSNYPDAISKVRDIAKHSIDPVPVLYPQVVELDKDKAVLIVQVPGDQETPFISKDGRIYRRNHDSSDPVPEASRYTIDRLVDNGRDIAKQFGKFCSDKRTFSKAEEQLSWINIFLSPYPIGTIERLDVISSEGIEQLLKLSQTPHKIYLLNSVEFGTGNLPLNFGQPTFGSAILRQVESSKAAFNSLTIELFVNGRAKFFIPLRYLLIQKDGTEHIKSPRVRVALGELWEADRESSTSYLRFFDIGQLWMMVANLVGYYREWLGKGPGLTDMRV